MVSLTDHSYLYKFIITFFASRKRPDILELEMHKPRDFQVFFFLQIYIYINIR